MGRLFSGMGWLTVLGAGAVLAFAQYRSSETGRDLVTVLKNLPEELQAAGTEWQGRLMQAVVAGKQAATEKEEEIERELAAKDPERHQEPDFTPEG